MVEQPADASISKTESPIGGGTTSEVDATKPEVEFDADGWRHISSTIGTTSDVQVRMDCLRLAVAYRSGASDASVLFAARSFAHFALNGSTPGLFAGPDQHDTLLALLQC